MECSVTATIIARAESDEKARKIAARIMLSEPDFSSEAFGRKLPFKDVNMRIRFIDMLKTAGYS